MNVVDSCAPIATYRVRTMAVRGIKAIERARREELQKVRHNQALAVIEENKAKRHNPIRRLLGLRPWPISLEDAYAEADRRSKDPNRNPLNHDFDRELCHVRYGEVYERLQELRALADMTNSEVVHLTPSDVAHLERWGGPR